MIILIGLVAEIPDIFLTVLYIFHTVVVQILIEEKK
jgi:hypothetical protein